MKKMTWVMSLTVGRRCQIDTELAFKEKLCSSKTALKMAALPQSTLRPPGTHLDAYSCQTGEGSTFRCLLNKQICITCYLNIKLFTKLEKNVITKM